MNLLDQNVLIFDCQTSGASPASSHMIEMGWANCSPHSLQNTVESSLVFLPDEYDLPRRISKMTGISREDLEGANTKENIWMNICKEGVVSNTPIVAHYARFEKPFLKELMSSEEPNTYCTYEIARRVYSDLPSRSIRAVSGFIGHSNEELKRSAHHVKATIAIWNNLTQVLTSELGVKTFDELNEWLKSPPPKKTKKVYSLAPKKRLSLPDEPGIYKLLNAKGQVLYVGKATSLKSRVNSYFRGQKTKGSRLNELVTQVADLDIIQVDSPLEAAIVESDTIKDLKPPYNRALRQDNREIAYCDPCFSPLEIDSDINNSIGPFSSLRFVKQINLMRLLVESAESLRTQLSENPSLMVEIGFEVEDSMLVEGVQVFRSEYLNANGGSVLSWTSLLVRLWGASIERTKQRRAEAHDEKAINIDEEDIENEVDTEQSLTPEQVARYLAGSFSGFAQRIHRARWLNQLANCQLYWGDGQKCWNAASVVNGVVTFSTIKSLPLNQLEYSDKLEFTVRHYDRMQTLSMEIRRLLKKEQNVRLYLPKNRILNEQQMRKFMYCGDFDD